jgi:Fe-S oxidoreductase
MRGLPRPDQRPLRVLPLLEGRRAELETCVFCPKLCRSTCPVSNAEPRETITPWGKMTAAYTLGAGSVPAVASHAAPPWACTGCYACKTACDHKNDVTGTLLDARRAVFATAPALAPHAARAATASFGAHERRTRDAVTELVRDAAAHGPRTGHGARGGTAFAIGCAYVRRAPRTAASALRVADWVCGEAVDVVDACCGLPLLLAGDEPAFVRTARAFAERVHGAEKLLVHDAGCALALRIRYAQHGVALVPAVEVLVERVAEARARLTPLAPAAKSAGPVRYHDPCQLGRGLGVYDAPRAILAHLFGRPPDEFVHARDHAGCSGGGGLLPLTHPEIAGEIATSRVREHENAGGGAIVTACASSLKALSGRGRGSEVEDIVTWIDRGLPCRLSDPGPSPVSSSRERA